MSSEEGPMRVFFLYLPYLVTNCHSMVFRNYGESRSVYGELTGKHSFVLSGLFLPEILDRR